MRCLIILTHNISHIVEVPHYSTVICDSRYFVTVESSHCWHVWLMVNPHSPRVVGRKKAHEKLESSKDIFSRSLSGTVVSPWINSC